MRNLGLLRRGVIERTVRFEIGDATSGESRGFLEGSDLLVELIGEE